METLASDLPATADNTALGNAPEADAGGSEAKGDGAAPSAPEAGSPATKVKDPVQERFDKLTREKYDALREGDRKGYLLEQRERELAELKAKLEARETTQVAPATTFPTLEQYGYDEAKFIAAVTAYNKATTEASRAAAREEAQEIIRAEREAARAEQAQQTWKQKESDFKKSKPDYDEKVMRDPRDGGPIITQSMAQIITESDVGPAVVYHLSENTELSAAIAKLPQIEQARAIGRIEARIEAEKQKPKPAVSQAPPPVAKVDGSDAPIEKSPSEMSDAEFAKWRKKQIAARRG